MSTTSSQAVSTPSPPQRSLALRSPMSFPSPSSDSPSPTRVQTPGVSHRSAATGRGDTVAAAFHVLDTLIESAGLEDLPIPTVAVAGQQSVGKSSLLSMLCNCPLWSSSRTATHGPTQIHSRHRPGQFSARIEIHASGVYDSGPSLAPFEFAHVSTKDGLAKLLKWAGDEARRGVGAGMRTAEELETLDEKARIADQVSWSTFTTNTVVLKVSGSDQPNLSIIDLPGITDENEAISRRLARKYLGKEETVILLCLAAGGPDPSLSHIETRLVCESDPDGVRTIGIVTKADRIDAPDDSAWGDFIAARGSACKTFHPRLGWHPVRMRTNQELMANVSVEQLVAIQADLFDSDEWRKLANSCGREFGWTITRNVIIDEFEKFVVRNVDVLRKRLASTLQVTTAELAKLPKEHDHPIGELFDHVIEPIAKQAFKEINISSTYSTMLHDAETAFIQNIFGVVPTFAPYRAFDKETHGDMQCIPVEVARRLNWPTGSIRKMVFVDELHELLMSQMNPRNLIISTDSARTHFLRPRVEEWNTMAARYIDDVWNATEKAVVSVVNKICETKPAAAKLAIRVLENEIAEYRTRSADFIRELCDGQLANPVYVEYYTSKDHEIFRTIKAHYLATFQKAYPPGSPPTSTSPGPSHPSEWTVTKQTIADLAASLTLHLSKGATRVSDVIGHKVQRGVQDFLEGIAPALRRGFGLEEVQVSTLKRTRELCDPDAETVLKRERLSHTKKQLESLRPVF